jgi:hypothetical protein
MAMRSILPPWYWIVVVGLLALPLAIKWFVKWILAPIIIHRRQTIAMRPDNRIAGPETLTPEMAELTAELVRQFNAEGFEFAANTYHANAVPGVQAVQIMLVNRSTNDIAVVIGTTAHARVQETLAGLCRALRIRGRDFDLDRQQPQHRNSSQESRDRHGQLSMGHRRTHPL